MSLNDDDNNTNTADTLYSDESGKVPIAWDKNTASIPGTLIGGRARRRLSHAAIAAAGLTRENSRDCGSAHETTLVATGDDSGVHPIMLRAHPDSGCRRPKLGFTPAESGALPGKTP